MARSYIPATVPMEFVNDFKTSSSESEDDGVTQCCQYPRPGRHRQRHQQQRDNSTIIEFVHVPTEGYGGGHGHCDIVASPELFRKNPENVKNNKNPRNNNTSYEVTVSPEHADNNFYQMKSNHIPASSTTPSPYDYSHSFIQSRSQNTQTFLYHDDDLGENLADIAQPSNVVTRCHQDTFYSNRGDSIDFELDYNLNHCSSSNNNSLQRRNGSLSSHSPMSMPSEETSLSTINSSGFKYKTQLLSRYSSQLEEENRMLKELLRNA